MNSSFYGGRQGASFVLARHFSSVAEMVEEFRKGPDYKEVQFDEYVLINTVNKGDFDNGKIYRRGHDFNNAQGGAEYVGTIVGPAGSAPSMKMDSFQNVKNAQEKNGYEHLKGSGSFSIASGDLVPGKAGSEYNDVIEWAYSTMISENGDKTDVTIGFKVPYLVTEFQGRSVDPYYNRSNQTGVFDNQNLIQKVDDGTHPFYSMYDIKVPRGVKGDSFKNLRVIPASAIVQDYPQKADDIANNREIVVFDYYHYDRNASGEPTTVYLGDYNQIKDILVNAEGTVTFKMTHESDRVFNKILKAIKQVSLNTETGKFIVEYNQETDAQNRPTKYEVDLHWVSNLDIAATGEITIRYTGGGSKTLETKLKTVRSVTMGANGQVQVHYNTGDIETITQKIKWIDSVSLADNGTFTVSFNDGTPAYTKTVRWVTNVEVADNGDLRIVYNNGNPVIKQRYLKTIRDVAIETGQREGEGDQRVEIFYNTGESKKVGRPINYILETAIDPENYHLLVRYSDPAKRRYYQQQSQSATYRGKNDWHDLGSVKEDAGILVGLNIAEGEVQNPSDSAAVIAYLNRIYPNGLQGADLKGKIVSVGGANSQKNFYAFDYNRVNGQYKKWYFLGGFQLNIGSLFMVEKDGTANIETKKAEVSTGGLWFVIEEE